MTELERMVTKYVKHQIYLEEHYFDKDVSYVRTESIKILSLLCGVKPENVCEYTVPNQFVLFDKFIITPKGKWRVKGKNTWYKYNTKKFKDLIEKINEGNRYNLDETMLGNFEENYKKVHDYEYEQKSKWREARAKCKKGDNLAACYTCEDFKFN
jgi:hypothetical protein